MTAQLDQIRAAHGEYLAALARRENAGVAAANLADAVGLALALGTDDSDYRSCCNSLKGSEHLTSCGLWEPPLSVEELRWLRTMVMTGGAVLVDGKPNGPACCGGGPQWGHRFDCPQCPE